MKDTARTSEAGATGEATPEPSGAHPSGFAPQLSGRRRRRWVLVATVLASAAILTWLLAFGLSRDPTVIRSPLLGRRAPAFTLRTLDGSRTVSLGALRGQVVVINFWASWCVACRVEHPALKAMWERYRDQGVVLLGIDFQDQKQAGLSFMRELGGDWPVLEDPGGRTAIGYGVYGIPETFFIGRDGVVRYKQVGPSSYELLTDEIQRLIDRSS